MAVVDLDLLGEEIRADGGLVLVAELVVDVPARAQNPKQTPTSALRISSLDPSIFQNNRVE